MAWNVVLKAIAVELFTSVDVVLELFGRRTWAQKMTYLHTRLTALI